MPLKSKSHVNDSYNNVITVTPTGKDQELPTKNFNFNFFKKVRKRSNTTTFFFKVTTTTTLKRSHKLNNEKKV